MAAMSAGSSGLVSGAKRATTWPLRLTRNFSKFQVELRQGQGLGAVLGEVAVQLGAKAGVGDLGYGLGVDEDFIKVGLVGAGGDNLFEHRESDVELGVAEGLNVFGRAGFLTGEVVGGKAEDLEAAVLVGAEELLEAFVLRGEATFGGGIDDKEDLSLVLLERGRLAGQGFHGNIEETGHSLRINDTHAAANPSLCWAARVAGVPGYRL